MAECGLFSVKNTEKMKEAGVTEAQLAYNGFALADGDKLVGALRDAVTAVFNERLPTVWNAIQNRIPEVTTNPTAPYAYGEDESDAWKADAINAMIGAITGKGLCARRHAATLGAVAPALKGDTFLDI